MHLCRSISSSSRRFKAIDNIFIFVSEVTFFSRIKWWVTIWTIYTNATVDVALCSHTYVLTIEQVDFYCLRDGHIPCHFFIGRGCMWGMRPVSPRKLLLPIALPFLLSFPRWLGWVGSCRLEHIFNVSRITPSLTVIVRRRQYHLHVCDTSCCKHRPATLFFSESSGAAGAGGTNYFASTWF